MKQLIIILFAIVSLAQAQTTDTTKAFFSLNGEGVYVKQDTVPGQLRDGVRAATISADTYVKLWLGAEYQATGIGLKANGTNQKNAIAFAVSHPEVSNILLSFDSTKKLTITDSADWANRTVRVGNGAYIGGGGKMKRLVIDVADNIQAFDTTITLDPTVKSARGYLTFQNFGTKLDNTTNVSAIAQKVIDICSSAGIPLKLTNDSMYIASPINLKSNLKLIGDKGAVMRMPNATYLRVISGNVSNINVEGIRFITSDSTTATNAGVISFIPTDSATDITMRNLVFENRGNASIGVYFSKVIRGTIENVKVYNSRAQSIWIESSENIYVHKTEVYNSGRSGIALHDSCTGVLIDGFIVDGFEQKIDLTDGGIDSYGDNNQNITIANGVVKTGTESFEGNANHIAIRIQGGRHVNISNVGIEMESQYGLYAVRIANRNNYYTENVTMNNLNIHVTGKLNTVFSFQGNRDPVINSSNVLIDSSATYVTTTGYPTIVQITSQSSVDTIRSVKLNGLKVQTSGHPFYYLATYAPIDQLSINEGTMTGSNQAFHYNGNFFIRTFALTGSTIISSRSSSLFTTMDTVKSYLVTGNTITKPGDGFFTMSSNYTGNVIVDKNIVNAKVGRIVNGGVYIQPATVTSSTYTVADTVAYVQYAPAANSTLTLPTNKYDKNRAVYVGNINTSGSFYVKIANLTQGKDTLRNGESALYHYDGTVWRQIGGSSTSAGVSLTTLQQAISDSLAKGYYLKPLGNSVGDSTITKVNDSTSGFKSIGVGYGLSASRTDSSINHKVDTSAISTKANVIYQINQTVDADTYSPSRGNSSNVASSSVESFMYQRTGKIVHFKGRLKVTASGAGATSLDLAIPYSPTLTAVTDLSGTGELNGSSFEIQAAPILLNVARISFTATGAVLHTITIDCMFKLP